MVVLENAVSHSEVEINESNEIMHEDKPGKSYEGTQVIRMEGSLLLLLLSERVLKPLQGL